MSSFASETRLIRLELVVRLRRLGWWPWIVLMLWALFAGAQEPRLLRSFGVNICWQATWSGATILLLAGSTLGPERGGASTLRRSGTQWVAALGLTALVAALQASVAWLIDWLTGNAVPLTMWSSSAVGFFLAWTPAAIAASALGAVDGGGGAAKLLLAGAVVFSAAISALCFTGPTAATVVACLLAAVGAGCLGALLQRAGSAAVPVRNPMKYPR